MPDLNRIYHVQSQERKPVLNTVSVPDAAGAFLRGAVPAAGAGAPALKARLADLDARYRDRIGRDRERWAAIGNLVGVGKEVGLAYAQAVERRDTADLNALQAAWEQHMAQGADAAWSRPYRRGGENGALPDGPLVAIQELDAAFDKSDAMGGARAGVKQRFSEWRRKAVQPYVLKASQRQTDAAEAFQQNALVAKWQANDAAVKGFYGLEDEEKWEGMVRESIAGKIEDSRFQMERKGLAMTAEQEAGIRRELRQQYEIERANYWCALAAASDTLTGGDDELAEAARVAADEKLVPDDAARLALKGKIEAARNTREANVERRDKKFAAENESLVYAITTESDKAKRDAALAQLRGNESGYALEKNKMTHHERAEKVAGFCDIKDFSAAYAEAERQMAAGGGSIESVGKALDGLSETAKELKTEEGREFAQKLLLQGRKQLNQLQQAEVAAFMEVAERGYRPVRFKDGRFGRVVVDIQQTVDAYHELAPYMDGAQAAKVEAAIRKRVSDEGLDIPTDEEVMLAFEWVGWRKRERDDLLGSFNDKTRKEGAPRVFTEAENPLVRLTEKGWTVDRKRFESLDASKASDRDGFIGVERKDGKEIRMDLETVQLVLDTLAEYKAQKALGKDGLGLDTLRKALLDRAEPLTNSSIVEAARKAADKYRSRWSVFQAPQAFFPE